ncbi:MAG: lipopolysaccharide heptosyltransferase II [Candidatus Rokuibacteriota bacterium]
MRPSGFVIALDAMRRVLVRFPNWLGDTVMAVPTLRALRGALPRAEVWGLGPWVASILEEEPGLDRRLAHPRGWRDRQRLAGQLRGAGIDLAILLPNSFEAAFHAWLTRARWRVGYAGDGRSYLLTHAIQPAVTTVHQVAEYLALLRPLGLAPIITAPTLAIAASRRTEARRLLAEIEIGEGTRAVAIQLGAAFGPSKLWPVDRLAALATRLSEQGTPAVFLGGSDAAPLLRRVEAALTAPARSLVGRDHPALLPALLAEFAVVVAPDSGPAHVAAAVGVPVVTVFGPTDPRQTAPLADRQTPLWRRPACAPCFQPQCPIDHRCMSAITVDDVVTAVRGLQA